MAPGEELERFLRAEEMRIVTEISRLRLEEDEVPYAGSVANRLDLDPSFLSKKLDEFEERGLVERGKRLGNLKVLELTEDGQVLSRWFEDLLRRVEGEKRFDARSES